MQLRRMRRGGASTACAPAGSQPHGAVPRPTSAPLHRPSLSNTTAVVWAATTKIGCGYTACPGGKDYVVWCAPAGRPDLACCCTADGPGQRRRGWQLTRGRELPRTSSHLAALPAPSLTSSPPLPSPPLYAPPLTSWFNPGFYLSGGSNPATKTVAYGANVKRAACQAATKDDWWAACLWGGRVVVGGRVGGAPPARRPLRTPGGLHVGPGGQAGRRVGGWVGRCLRAVQSRQQLLAAGCGPPPRTTGGWVGRQAVGWLAGRQVGALWGTQWLGCGAVDSWLEAATAGEPEAQAWQEEGDCSQAPCCRQGSRAAGRPAGHAPAQRALLTLHTLLPPPRPHRCRCTACDGATCTACYERPQYGQASGRHPIELDPQLKKASLGCGPNGSVGVGDRPQAAAEAQRAAHAQLGAMMPPTPPHSSPPTDPPPLCVQCASTWCPPGVPNCARCGANGKCLACAPGWRRNRVGACKLKIAG